MRIAVAADHHGYRLKQHLKELLAGSGHEVVDLGPDGSGSVDYPSYAAPAARRVGEGAVDAGVLICGSGVGVAIVANKVHGVRAVHAHDPDEAALSRRHNDANVLTLAGARLSEPDADAIVEAFLNTPFDGGRHARRVAQIRDLEADAQR